MFYAVTICSSEHYRKYLPVAENLFKTFIKNYNKHFHVISSNTHNLVHIVDEVKKFGSLSSLTSYPFENFLFQIKNMVRSGRLPLNQIINRISEKTQPHNNSPVIQSYPSLKQPSRINGDNFLYCTIYEGFRLTNKFEDKWFLTNDKSIVAMNFANEDGIVGSELKQFEAHVEKPFPSDVFYIYRTITNNDFSSCKLYPFSSIFCKLVAIEIHEETIFVPLHHTLPEK